MRLGRLSFHDAAGLRAEGFGQGVEVRLYISLVRASIHRGRTLCNTTGIQLERKVWLKSQNGCDVTTPATIDVNSIVSGRNYEIVTSIITKLLTSSRPFVDLSPKYNVLISLLPIMCPLSETYTYEGGGGGGGVVVDLVVVHGWRVRVRVRVYQGSRYCL